MCKFWTVFKTLDIIQCKLKYNALKAIKSIVQRTYAFV